MLIDYFIKEQYKIKRFDLFAGDMFYDDLFFEIIKPIKKYFKFLNEQYPDFINYHINHTVTGNKKSINPAVIIPCNMSFCNSEEKIAKVQAITNEFKELNVNLFF